MSSALPLLFSKIKEKFIYLFIYGCTGSSLLRTGFLWLWRVGATLHCGVQVSLVSEHRLQAHGLQKL